MGKKILIVTGSPRKQGNTNTIAGWVADAAREAGADVRLVNAATLKYKTGGCMACMGCQESSEYRCVIQDEASDIIASIPDYDLLVLASPVYFFSFTAQIKPFIDRMYSLTKFSDSGIQTALENTDFALIADSAGDMGSGLDMVVKTTEKIAGFFGRKPATLLVPNCPFEVSETIMDSGLKEKARKFGADLA